MKYKILILLAGVLSISAAANEIDVAPESSTTKSNGCGIITLNENPPKTKNVYYAAINQIDGQTVSSRSTRFALAAGKHTIKVIEKIQDSSFTRRRGEMKNYKYITLDVKPNVKYSLGAKFDRSKRSKLKTGEYWEPVVWRMAEKKCS